jgi:hypothetical protein
VQQLLNLNTQTVAQECVSYEQTTRVALLVRVYVAGVPHWCWYRDEPRGVDMFVVFGVCALFTGSIVLEATKRFFRQPENRVVYGIVVGIMSFITLVLANLAITSLGV